MLFHREPRPGDEETRLWVPEEQTTTPMNLFRIGFFAAAGFLVMAWMSEPGLRGAPLFVGGLILTLLGLTAGFLLWQRRYGEATLKAKMLLTYGQRFEGWIETELTHLPARPVVVKLEGRRGKYVALSARDEVIAARMQKDEAGKVRIPFSMQVPANEDGRAMDMRVYVRTKTWPVGWGATFLLS